MASPAAVEVDDLIAEDDESVDQLATGIGERATYYAYCETVGALLDIAERERRESAA